MNKAKGWEKNKGSNIGLAYFVPNAAKNVAIAVATSRLFNKIRGKIGKPRWHIYFIPIPKSIYLFILLSVVFSKLKAEKHALLIGVGTYPKESAWQQLSSEKDTEYIKAALLNRGFLEKNIRVLVNQATTKRNIFKAINTLTNTVQKGDIVYIHFSGHGQQIIDVSGDEIDGLDEALVPYDSPMSYQKGSYEGERLILDDEVKIFTDTIRAKLGKKGQLIFAVDACHSGTSIRGDISVRGTTVVMGSVGSETAVIDTVEQSYSFHNDRFPSHNFAPMASFFASGANEANFESEGVGSFSFAMAKALNNQGNALTVQELFEGIKLTMSSIAPYQHPQLEGNKELLVFNTTNSSLKRFYVVEKIITPKRILASFGLLHDIPVGSKVEIVRLDTDEAITTGEVHSSSLQYSEIKLEHALSNTEEVLFKIKVISKAAPPINCYVKIDASLSDNWKETVEKLRDKRIFTEVEMNYDLYLSLCEADDLLELRTKSGDLLVQTNPQKSTFYNTRKLENEIKAFTQTKFLRQYETQSELDLSLELKPVKTKRVEGVLIPIQTFSIENYINEVGTLQFEVGDAVQFEISNHSTQPAYFSIIDIQPDNQIGLLVPSLEREEVAADYFIAGNTSIVLSTIFRFGEPYGRDVLKLIATNQPLDLGSILANNGLIKREEKAAPLHSFEQLLSYTYQQEQIRGMNSEQLQVSDVGVSSLIYEIIE